MIIHSEYNTKPSALIVCHPKHSLTPSIMNKISLVEHNFEAIPSPIDLFDEYDSFIHQITSFGISTIDIFELVAAEYQNLLSHNPNAMFTRDSSITIPWNQSVVIIPRFKLSTRENETIISKSFFASQKSFQILECPYKLEGGDVIPFILEGKKTLLVGIGQRTERASAKWLYDTLAGNSIDQVVIVEHDKRFLHLDTCLSILPNMTVLGALSAQKTFVIINPSGYRVMGEAFPQYLINRGYTWIDSGTIGAIRKEQCNLLPLGNNTFIGFNLDDYIRLEVEKQSGANLISLPSKAIILANGGAHCLTRPIYY